MYSFHIEFSDHSNPYYHFPCNYRKHLNAIKKWKRNYNLTVLARSENMIYFYAVPKIPTPQLQLFL